MGFKFDDSIDDFVNTISFVRNNYPKEVKKFMKSEGTKLRDRTRRKAKSSVGKKTGNYQKGIKRGKYYKYRKDGADSIRVYAGKPAYHGHLIEYGHDMKTHSGEKVGTVKGYHIFKTAADKFENVYEKNCEKFLNKIVEPLNKG